MANFVAYYRVSTQRQGVDGLGMSAQRNAVEAYVKSVGGAIIASFSEVESGKSDDRPQLHAALEYAHKKHAMLVIARLDRLARKVSFISQLMESGVEFVAADMPHANRLTVHLIAAVAEYEREVISARTKKALTQAKKRGVKLGNPKAREQAPIARKQAILAANDFALRIAPILKEIELSGITSLSRMAAVLQARGIKTQRGGTWSAAGVRNIIERLKKIESEEFPG